MTPLTPMLLDLTLAALTGVLAAALGARCVERLPADRGLLARGAACSACGAAAPTLVEAPVAGPLRARACAACGARPDRLRALEDLLVAAGVAAALFLRGFNAAGVSDALFVWALVVVASVDRRHMVIETYVLLPAAAARVALLAATEPERLPALLAGCLAAAGALYFVALVYETVRNRQGLGEGDPAVFGVVALWVDWTLLPMVVLAAALGGLLVGGGGLVLRGRDLATTRVPFAPALAFGGLAVYAASEARLIPGFG